MKNTHYIVSKNTNGIAQHQPWEIYGNYDRWILGRFAFKKHALAFKKLLAEKKGLTNDSR
jgi:hypothetical protein